MSKALRRPESALVVVYTREFEFLLLERVAPADFWQSVTGSLDWGEMPAQAARRELQEETGLSGADLRDGEFAQSFPILPQWRDRFAADVATNLEHVWYLELAQRAAVTLNPAEHRRYEWLEYEAALERVTSWTNRDAIAALQRDAE